MTSSELQLDPEARALLRALVDRRRRELIADEARVAGRRRPALPVPPSGHAAGCRCDDCLGGSWGHGTRARYRRGCDCADCRAAVATERQRSRDRARGRAANGR